ncbi:3-oxoacyl-[acyl-carrier protein] reductase [Candidatus Nitrosotalea sp. TS]|uniref:SDR family oxidoreductase n=1 Tax=Candidatus Nitrosotalea sp. TS TaxID=2341020 RepID=UPI00140C3AB4|nr:SDR family oxidoreductase [Candidatus Nitrosotalea sp. TS]NHI04336.1 3-oxoacyl-[acyl-carrier protein] reductase [Candidatus Nitrosotalea sp. TS]
MASQKVAIVTGSSGGIGYETALVLARNGFRTYATMRNLEKAKAILDVAKKEKLSLHTVKLDVTNEKSVNDAIKTIKSDAGRIDVLVNNAGYGLAGPLEDLSMSEIKEQYETNVFGLIRVTQAVLFTMREQKNGIIVNISSIGGKMAMPLLSPYIGTKFAVEGLSESIAYELEPFGIKVVLIEPGVIKTNFDTGMVVAQNQNPSSPYYENMQKLQSAMSSIIKTGTPSAKVAEVILGAITAPNPSMRYTVGDDAAMLAQKRKELSDSEFKKLVFDFFK